jgi:hypothetical protein
MRFVLGKRHCNRPSSQFIPFPALITTPPLLHIHLSSCYSPIQATLSHLGLYDGDFFSDRRLLAQTLPTLFYGNFNTFIVQFYYFVKRPTNAQLSHKLSHYYMFRHYCVILRELLINALPITQLFKMQLLVIQFVIKMFHAGFMHVLVL